MGPATGFATTVFGAVICTHCRLLPPLPLPHLAPPIPCTSVCVFGGFALQFVLLPCLPACSASPPCLWLLSQFSSLLAAVLPPCSSGLVASPCALAPVLAILLLGCHREGVPLYLLHFALRPSPPNYNCNHHNTPKTKQNNNNNKKKNRLMSFSFALVPLCFSNVATHSVDARGRRSFCFLLTFVVIIILFIFPNPCIL